MPFDAQITVAPDNLDPAAKAVDMDRVATQAGAAIYRQRADLVGESGALMQQILTINLRQLYVLRAVLSTLQQANNGFGVGVPNVAGEADFEGQPDTNNDY